MASINYFDSDMYNSTNTVVCFDEKDGNLYLRLRAMSHTIHAAKSEYILKKWNGFTLTLSVILI
jgi:hypothetical protein